jgi:anti-sigma factor RsiW
VTPADLPEDLLSAYVDGELDADTRAAVETQLSDSAAWRETLGEVAATRDAVRALPPLDLSPEAWDRLLGRVGVDEPDRGGASGRVAAFRRSLRRQTGPWIGAVAGAAAVAALVAALVVPNQQRVTPKVATFSTQQQARASVVGDPVSALAGASLTHGMGR